MNKNFNQIIELIDVLNRMSDGIRSGGRFSYQVEGYRMYVKGLACDLASLYNLLWANCYDYSFRLSWADGSTVLECY